MVERSLGSAATRRRTLLDHSTSMVVDILEVFEECDNLLTDQLTGIMMAVMEKHDEA